MNAPPVTPSTNEIRRAPAIFQKETGQPLGLWALVALLNFATQIVFRHEFAMGEFGALNTALGVLGLATVPLVALEIAIFTYGNLPSTNTFTASDNFRTATLFLAETFAWVWALAAIVLCFLLLPLLDLPRYPLQLFTLINLPIAIGGVFGGILRRQEKRLLSWAWLLVIAAGVRLILAFALAPQAPWAESGLAIVLVAGFIPLTPALRDFGADFAARLKICRETLDRPFLVYAAAAISVFLGMFLFSSADRLVAQSWFGTPNNTNLSLVNWKEFDSYQTGGLLGRALLWGTQPLLWVLFAHRSRVEKTRPGTLTFLWIYLGVLFIGSVLLLILSSPISHLFCGDDYQITAVYTQRFAEVFFPLGVMQALGMFALASRRYPECFLIGASGVAYLAMLYLVGRQPELMIAYMFGGGLVSIMLVLFVGVVRWGRKQP